MQKKLFLTGLLIIVLASLALALSEVAPPTTEVRPPEAKKEKIISFEAGSIRVQIADSQKEREKGLSSRKNLASDEGLLFIFEKPGFYGFWMKDMTFPIDIIWLDENLRIVHVEKNISPETFPTIFSSPIPSQYVLEINSGLSDQLGLTAGSKITLH